MKTTVVYYTRFGHSAVVARELAERLSGELVQIEEARSYPIPELARAVVICHFEIKPMNLDYSGYDRLVLCTPIWMQHPACPARTFLRDARLSGPEIDVVFLSISGSIAEATEVVADYLSKQGIRLHLTGSILTGKTADEELRRAADDFARRLTA